MTRKQQNHGLSPNPGKEHLRTEASNDTDGRDGTDRRATWGEVKRNVLGEEQGEKPGFGFCHLAGKDALRQV